MSNYIDYTVDTLVTDVKTTASIPAAQPRFDQAGIIRIMQRMLKTKVVPMITKVREEFFVEYEDFEIIQGNTTGYAIPSNAVGMKVRDVVLVNQGGVLNLTSLPRLTLEQISGYYFGQTVPFGYYFQNNNVILWPPNQTTPTNTLRMYFLCRTRVLTSTDNCGQIEAIVGNVVTLSNVPTDWALGTHLNAIDNNPGFNTKNTDMEITLIAGNDVTLDNVEDLAEDYWLATQGYSPIVQTPVECHELLVQETSLEILKSLGGDPQAIADLRAEIKEQQSYCMNIMSPRSEGNPKKAIQAGSGIMDWCGFSWRR